MKNMKRVSKGFTLIELMIVIAIIAILLHLRCLLTRITPFVRKWARALRRRLHQTRYVGNLPVRELQLFRL